MHNWKGVLCHTIMVSAQPLYLTFKQLMNPYYLQTMSKTWLAITILTWLYILTQLTIPYYNNPLRQVASPSGDRFPIGHMNFRGGRPPTDHIVQQFEETPNDGFYVCWGPLYMGGSIFLTKPETIMELVNTHNYDWEKPPLSRRFLARTLGQGLVNVEGNQHKAMRKAVAPAFSGKHIRDLVPLFYAKGLAFVDALAREIKKTPDSVLEIGASFSHATLDLIGAAGIGKDFNTIENGDDELAKLYELITTPVPKENMLASLLVNIYLPTWIIKRLYGTIYKRRIDAQAQLRLQVQQLLLEKKERIAEKTEDEKDILAIIMRSGDYSEEYLTDQLLTFLAAGHDTTSSSLTWTIYLLSLNPSIQDRLREECKLVLSTIESGNIDGSTFEATTMPYLNAVCNETLRLYPTVPATARICVKPTTINGHSIPVGTLAVICIWAINRDPKLWGSDSTTYNPDRWLKGEHATNGGAVNPYALTTFLHGPRSCIGQTFAKTEMKCLLATLVKRYRFELANPDEPVETAGLVTIKPRNGLRVKMYDLADKE